MNRKLMEADTKLKLLTLLPALSMPEMLFVQSLLIIVNSPLKRDLHAARSLTRKALRRTPLCSYYKNLYDHNPVFVPGLRILHQMKKMINDEVPVECQDELILWYQRNFEWIDNEFKTLKNKQ